MSTTILWLGFLLGIRHAMDADHLVAVASLATGTRSRWGTARVAAGWGLGHGTALLLLGLAISLTGFQFPAAIVGHTELVAGILLLVLGADVLRRLWRSRDVSSDPQDPPVLRSFVVGSAHGLAGSGALAALVLPTLPTTAAVVLYIGLFGAGTILGMLLCSVAITVPMRFSLRSPVAARWLMLGAGTTSVLLGTWITATAL